MTQRGKKLSAIKIAAMEQDWIVSTVRPKREEFGQKHGIAQSTVQRYYEKGHWKDKRRAYWENIGQVVTEVSKVSLAQASRANGLGANRKPATDLQREETVEQSVEVVGRFIAGAVNQREDQTTKAIGWIKDVLLQVLQGITVNNDQPLVVTGDTTEEMKMELKRQIGAIPIAERVKILPRLIDSIIDVVRIEEVMQGRPDHTMGIIGTPQDLTPEEEAALEIVKRISLRASGEGSHEGYREERLNQTVPSLAAR